MKIIELNPLIKPTRTHMLGYTNGVVMPNDGVIKSFVARAQEPFA